MKSIIHEWGIDRVHIGTCVRKNKYGPVDGDMVSKFRQAIDSCI